MKERLTGAIIVVALLVLLVPELLTGPESKSSATPAGSESAPVRTYTIDLADNPSANRAANPALAPETAVTEEPVAQATPEEAAPETDPPEVPAVEGTPTDLGVAQGSSADAAAADRAAVEEPKPAERSSGSVAAEPKPATPEPERPRSAFGPGAVERPPQRSAAREPSAPAARESSAAARSEPAPRVASSGASKGSWSVQLGAFGSRENAERLVKQVKGKGFPVAINENASSKLRYRVRVGPEKDRAAADALAKRLRAAGHKDATVVPAS